MSRAAEFGSGTVSVSCLILGGQRGAAGRPGSGSPQDPASPAAGRSGGIAERTRRRHADVRRLSAAARTRSLTSSGCPATPCAGSPAPPTPASSSSTTGRRAAPASCTTTSLACGNGGTRAEPTPQSSGRRSAQAATGAATLASATTSRVSAETSTCPPLNWLPSPRAHLVRHRPARRPGRRHRRADPAVELRQRRRARQPHQMLKRQMYGRAHPTCSASASCSPTNPTKTVPETKFSRR